MIFGSRLWNWLLICGTFAACGVVAVMPIALATYTDQLAIGDEYRLEPEPMDPEKLPTPVVEHELPADRLPSADPRPLLTICVEPGCQPCVFLEREIAAHKLDDFQIEVLRAEKDQCPAWVHYFPAAIFTDAKGRRMVMPAQDGEPRTDRPAPTAATIIARWQELNPGTLLQSAAAAPPKTLLDQLAMYLGPGGTITIQPSRPIAAVMEDGTKLSYSRLSGKYQIVNGIPSIMFDPPFARVDARKFLLHVGAEIKDARFEPPSTASVGTTAGRYRFIMERAE